MCTTRLSSDPCLEKFNYKVLWLKLSNQEKLLCLRLKCNFFQALKWDVWQVQQIASNCVCVVLFFFFKVNIMVLKGAKKRVMCLTFTGS